MAIEELTCKEIQARINKMNSRDGKAFFEGLPPETQRRYQDYVTQRLDDYYSLLVKILED
jgi:hypothetical protein